MKYIFYILFVFFAIVSCATNVKIDLHHMKKRKLGFVNNSNYKKSQDSVTNDEINTEKLIGITNFRNSYITYDEMDNPSISASSYNDIIFPSDSARLSLVSNKFLVGLKSKNSLKEENECEEIITRNGDIIEAKIIEIGVTEIKYKKCGNIEGPSYSMLKSDVFMIKYKNGDKDVFNEKKSSSSAAGSDESKVEPFSIVSLSTGITGLALGIFTSMAVGIILGILGIIFGLISIRKVNSNPNKYSKISPKLAKAGLITGIVIAALSTAVLLVVFFL
jgi:hypothetical protein